LPGALPGLFGILSGSGPSTLKLHLNVVQINNLLTVFQRRPGNSGGSPFQVFSDK